MVPAIPPRLALIHRSLGIPFDYGATRGLVPQLEAGEEMLVTIAETPDRRRVSLTRDAAGAWFRLQADAVANGIALLPLSGFRSIAQQEEIFRRKLAAGQRPADILRVIAAPGYSEHHTGRALDLGTPGEPALEASFATTPAFQWLSCHALTHGFVLSYPRENPHQIVYEPWHWFWRG